MSPDKISAIVQNGIFPDGSDFDPLKSVLLEKIPENPPVAHPQQSIPISDRVIFTSYAENKFSLEALCSGPRWLVLSEIYYPGWKARLDGKDWPVEPAYGMLRCMMLGAGFHRVEMSFYPRLIGLGIKTAFGCIITLAAGLSAIGIFRGKSPRNA